ncbi:MAG TPA: DUF2851 family protein [Puia sp.]|nr:DUF2851 family protein [Puia sp.]
MTEKLLQFIWRFRYFSQRELCTENGENISIIHPGVLNNNQGPDFLNAKIKIDRTIWIGNIELHLQSSQWEKHEHGKDKNYNNVILHVVWIDDAGGNERNIPTLVLHQRISRLLLEKYKEWMESPSFIPCKNNIGQTHDMIWLSWKERLLAERLHRKSILVRDYLFQNKDHWEETLWWMIAGNFGSKVNTGIFETIARNISTQILAKHKNQICQLEAMLMGQAGLLESDFKDEYPLLLKKEYQFLKKKYQLPHIHQPVHFLRMRPGNFPTIRLSQLASLVHSSSHLFSRIKEIKTITEIKELLAVTVSDYWMTHYVFEEVSPVKNKTLGDQMKQNIIINSLVPVLYTYGIIHQLEAIKNKSISWLESMLPEKNSVMEEWNKINVEAKNSFDSQALLELKTHYCDRRRCLECAIGNALLKRIC